MFIAWIFGVSFGTILTIGASNAINKPHCVKDVSNNCVVIGEKK